jgi:hypothetical protein
MIYYVIDDCIGEGDEMRCPYFIMPKTDKSVGWNVARVGDGNSTDLQALTNNEGMAEAEFQFQQTGYYNVKYYGNNWLSVHVIDASSVQIIEMKRFDKDGNDNLLISGGKIDPTDIAVSISVNNPLTSYWALWAYNQPGPNSYGKEMLTPIEGINTFKKEGKNDFIVVYPRYFIPYGDVEPVKYYFKVPRDPGYGDVDFWLFDNQFVLRPPDPRQWAELGICCRSKACPDSKVGRWIGGQVNLETSYGVYGPFGNYNAWGKAIMSALDYSAAYPVKITCSGLAVAPALWVSVSLSGVLCWGGQCIEDLEGVSLGNTFALTSGPVQGSFGLDYSAEVGCASLSVPPFGTGTPGGIYAIRDCMVEKWNLPW